MLTKEECVESLGYIWNLAIDEVDRKRIPYNDLRKSVEKLQELIKEHFDNPPYQKGYQDCMDEKVKFLEKALDIAIKDLCFSATGADACNSLEVLYVGIRDRIMEQARKEV